RDARDAGFLRQARNHAGHRSHRARAGEHGLRARVEERCAVSVCFGYWEDIRYSDATSSEVVARHCGLSLPEAGFVIPKPAKCCDFRSEVTAHQCCGSWTAHACSIYILVVAGVNAS